jgi:glycosyltransferase involved in cell wall biosynthesis
MGYPRSWEMLRIVCGLDYDVTFLPASIPEESWPSVYSLVPRDVEVVLGVFRDRIESFLSRRIGYYDVILASREYNMRPLDAVIKRRPQWFAGVRIVYDAEALFCLRQKNFDELMGKPWSTERLESEIAAEVQVTRSADVVLSVTEIDRKNVEPTVTPFSSRKDILFVGSMHFHPSPNSDSILWFVENVFPEIRARLGDVRLLVVGINKVRAVTALASDAVQMLGVVPDLSSLFEQSRIFIAPTRYSGGVPLKVCEAAAWGLPCVVTDLVASQIGWKNGQGLLSAPVSDATGFAAQCVKLYTDESVWTGVRETALTQISELCSEAAFRATLESALAPGPRSR